MSNEPAIKVVKNGTEPQNLVIAISSMALFDLEESHDIYINQGVKRYSEYQIQHEDEILDPGPAFPLVKKLLNLRSEQGDPLVEVILLSRNSADTGLRIFNSIEKHNLRITRAAFTSGDSPYRYVKKFNSHLFLSTNGGDVRKAIEEGVAAATIVAPAKKTDFSDEIRFAFDGDAVLFSDDAEKIYQEQGLEAFTQSEKNAAKQPLPGGPFKSFLAILHHIQHQYTHDNCPIKTALVTARSAPTHERVIRTLRSWNIRIDQALFLGGLSKGAFLEAFGADVFFDDQLGHCDSAREHVAAGHVPHGISNKTK
ncbi:MAG: 5'-nucleotidase [Gammaproteobacteria bacterium CG22_combo_CG10-13_8_21_14_all_40_8]|nr:MAG: 5'-nucleotidase [Gammaproteobacteria bacterium CG22_combo_CG10-13_8_21_14_all_40_8]